MNNALEEVYLWTQNNKLLLNTNNTKVMVIGSRQRIQKLNENNLNVHIRSTTIECVSHYKCLGVIVDSNLLFSKHVERVALQIKQKLGILRRLRGTFNTRSVWYTGDIFFLMLCTVALFHVWTNRSHHNYEIINQLHKRAAYIISGCSWYTPLEQVLVQLNWSSLQELYSKALGYMAFKCVHYW